MGADLILSFLYIEKDKQPNWEAGKKALAGLLENEDEDPLPTEKDIEDLFNAWADKYRDAVLVNIGEYAVLISGGMSWGDDPTDTYAVIDRVANYPQVYEAMGFK